MRSSLFVSGVIVTLTGVALFAALDGIAWLVLIACGVVVSVSGYLLEESTERVEPPIGFQFCVFCSTPVPEGAERCDHCNGIQPFEERKKRAPAQPVANN
jgi:predicted nucleic acid-binding Zn ribbon protein